MDEEALLLVYPSEEKHCIGYVVGRTNPTPKYPNGQMVIKELVKFSSLESLEQHAYKILEYIGKIREEGIPREIRNSYKLEEE